MADTIQIDAKIIIKTTTNCDRTYVTSVEWTGGERAAISYDLIADADPNLVSRRVDPESRQNDLIDFYCFSLVPDRWIVIEYCGSEIQRSPYVDATKTYIALTVRIVEHDNRRECFIVEKVE